MNVTDEMVKAARAEMRPFVAPNNDTLRRAITAALSLAPQVKVLDAIQVEAINKLDSALCNFLNGASDEYDPRLWIPETKRNFEKLCDVYNLCHVVKVMDIRRPALEGNGHE